MKAISYSKQAHNYFKIFFMFFYWKCNIIQISDLQIYCCHLMFIPFNIKEQLESKHIKFVLYRISFYIKFTVPAVSAQTIWSPVRLAC